MNAVNAQLPPGPKGHWLLGSLREFRRDNLAFYRQIAANYGGIASYRLGPHRIVLVSDPDLIEQVLVTDNRHYRKHYILRLLTPVLGKGLVTSEGNFWLRQRKLIQPAFNRQRIDSYAGIMLSHTERLISAWRDGETRNIHADMMQLALGIVSKALLDVDAGDRYGEIAEPIEVILHDFERRFLSAFSPPFWMPTPGNRKLAKAVRRLDAILDEIIRQRRTEHRDRGDLLSLLVQARDEDDQSGMTDRQLRDEVMTLFLAGHETTANVLTWTWYLLATHPDVESRLAAELRDVLGDSSPALVDVPNLKYTEQVLLESMRLYPPVYSFGREATADVELGGYGIPAGTTVLLSQWVVHRDARYFMQPGEFRPDRWAGEFARQLPRYAYFPFGGGPRVCIGNTFAQLEATLVLATIAGRFRMTLCADPPVVPRASVTLRPEHGICCVVNRR